jgi:hypothetical protein
MPRPRKPQEPPGGHGEGEFEAWDRDRYGSRTDEDRPEYGSGWDRGGHEYGRGQDDEPGASRTDADDEPAQGPLSPAQREGED